MENSINTNIYLIFTGVLDSFALASKWITQNKVPFN